MNRKMILLSTPAGPRQLYGLGAIGLLALALRIGAIFVLQSYHDPDATYEHGTIAENIVRGRGFQYRMLGGYGYTSHQAPLYPYLLAGFYSIWGIEKPSAILAMQIFQAFSGALLAVVVIQLGIRMFPQRAAIGWLAGIGVAVYPTLVYCVTHIQCVSLITFFLATTLWLAYKAVDSGNLKSCLPCAIVSGLMLLTDPIMALAVGVVTLMLLVMPQMSFVRRAALAGSFLVTTFLVISPWIIRNWQVHGEFVFIKDTFGLNLWEGNNPISMGTGRPVASKSLALLDKPSDDLMSMNRALWEASHEAVFIDDVLFTHEDFDFLGKLPEPERARRLLWRALDYIKQNPGSYARLCLQRLRFFLLFDETNPKTKNVIYRASHLTLDFLCLVGLLLCRRDWRRFWPTCVLFIALAVFHTLTIVAARFHIPLEPIQILWAAMGVTVVAGIVRPISGSGSVSTN